jgi:hypothetical protein
MLHAKHPLFPKAISEQIADLNSKRNYLKTVASRLGIPTAEITKIDTQVNAVFAANAAASDPDTRTKLDTANRRQAISTAQENIRKVIVFYITGNPNTTNVDYEALSIPRPGPHPHLPPPEHIPGIGHITSSYLAVIIPFFDGQTGRRGRPDGVRSIEVLYKLGGEPPTDVSEMTEHKVENASPMRLQFGFNDYMKTVYLVFRWIGTRGDFGPWSEIYEVSIAR